MEMKGGEPIQANGRAGQEDVKLETDLTPTPPTSPSSTASSPPVVVIVVANAANLACVPLTFFIVLIFAFLTLNSDFGFV